MSIPKNTFSVGLRHIFCYNMFQEVKEQLYYILGDTYILEDTINNLITTSTTLQKILC